MTGSNTLLSTETLTTHSRCVSARMEGYLVTLIQESYSSEREIPRKGVLRQGSSGDTQPGETPSSAEALQLPGRVSPVELRSLGCSTSLLLPFSSVLLGFF